MIGIGCVCLVVLFLSEFSVCDFYIKDVLSYLICIALK